MSRLDVLVVAAILRAFPAAFRQRFGAEMLATYGDQRDALRGRLAVSRHALRTAAGLLRALVAVRLEARRPSPTSVPRQPAQPMQNFLRDVRHGLRQLRARPGFAAVAVLTLALGIGANTAVFSVLNGVILAPLPYDEPGQLVRIYTADRRNPGDRDFNTGLDLMDVREQVQAFSSLGILYTYREVGADLTTGAGSSERVRVLPVSAGYFTTYRATPLLGRAFTQDEEYGDARLVVLSHHLWSALSGRDPAFVGRTIELNGLSFEVIGVMRPTFADVIAGEIAAWVPADLRRAERGSPFALHPGNNTRVNQYLTATARLAPGVTVAQAEAQMNGAMSRLAAEFPDSHKDRIMRAVPLHEDVTGGSKAAVYILMGSAMLVLLIACLNVANLFLARALARSRETAIRTALGAARGRLVGQGLTESLVVAVAGGIAGSVIAWAGVKTLLAVSPEALPRAEEVGFDPQLLAFAAAVVILTTLLFGAGPALRASRSDPIDAMHEGARGSTGGLGAARARNLLVVSQVSFALILLVGAGLLIRAFVAQQRLDLGFTSADVATFEVHLPQARYPEPERRALFHRTYLARLGALPTAASAGVTSWLPANGRYHHWGFRYTKSSGEETWASAQTRVVDGEIFPALKIPVVRGRAFEPSDAANTPRVALISASIAKKFFADADPLGQKIQVGGQREWTVVGVVGDVAHEARGERFEMIYLSHAQFADNRNWGLTYVVRAADASSVFAAARRELASLDPALVLHRPRSMDAVLGVHRARDRFVLVLMATFGAIALTLAAVGVYGVLSYSVTQRTREIGVRMALGARPGQVRASILAHGMAVAGAGIVLGAGGAFALARFLETLAVGVDVRDPLVFAGAIAVLSGAVLVAGYLPARKATRVDPLEALRSD